MSGTESRAAEPAWLLRAASGVVAAASAVGVGHAVAAAGNPAAAPLIAVGSALVDAAPTPAKEFAVRTFGTADKPILLASVALVLAGVAAGLGVLAWRRRTVSLAGMSLLGVAGAAAALYRGGFGDTVPSVVAGLVAVGTLLVLTRLGTGSAARASTAAGPEPARSSRHAVPAGTVPSRRGLLLGLGAAGLLAAVGGGTGVVIERARRAGAAARRMLALPAPRSAARAIPAGAQVDGVVPFVTANEDFYRVDISLVTPSIDTQGWTLTIDGMVDRPVTLSYQDLLALPMIERTITMTCVSNEVGGSYVSTARWLGVPFREIIARVGVRDGVDQVYSYSLDSGYTCSTPYQAVSDGRDAMIAVGMNGEPLPDANGFPARMLVPGLFGFVSATKWLSRIEFTTYAERVAYWTERGWATDAPVLTQSRIEVPRSLSTVPRDRVVLAGVAWAQHRGIATVEVRVDDGDWHEAKLAADAGIDVWRQWSYVYDGPPGLHTAQVRATDAAGNRQPEERTKVFPSGATGWHQIQFTTT